jgi:hypothetical protein
MCDKVMHSWAFETCGTKFGVYCNDGGTYYCPAHIPEMKRQREAVAKMEAAGHVVKPARTSPGIEKKRRLSAIEKAEEAAKKTKVNPFLAMTSSRSPQATAAHLKPDAQAALAATKKDLPEMSVIERNRSMKQKLPPSGLRGRQVTQRKTIEPKVSAQTRVNEFPAQSLRVQAGDLYCGCCKTILSKMKTTVKVHVESVKHIQALKTFNVKADQDQQLGGELVAYYKANPDEKDSSVREADAVFRYRVVETFMAAGVELAKINAFKQLLQRSGHTISDASGMGNSFVPKIEAAEIDLISRELTDQHVSYQFDGTTRLGEAIAMVARFCDEGFNIQYRMAAFLTTFSHTKGKNAGALLVRQLLTTLKVDMELTTAFTRDSCAANNTAMGTLQPLFVASEDFLCICHTVDNMGNHFHLEVLGGFMTHWLILVQHQAEAKAKWKATIKTSMKGFSNTRWWSKNEVQNEIAENYAAVPR